MIRRPPRSTQSRSSAASDVYKRQGYCWGNNTAGELGNGTTTSSAKAVASSSGLLSFGAVSVGNSLDRVDQHSCGLTTGGRVYCWGYNNFGEIGDGTKNNSLVPVQASVAVTFSAVRVGGAHTCGMTTDGVYCWGDNTHGELGIGSHNPSLTPVPINGGLSFILIPVSYTHLRAHETRHD